MSGIFYLYSLEFAYKIHFIQMKIIYSLPRARGFEYLRF